MDEADDLEEYVGPSKILFNVWTQTERDVEDKGFNTPIEEKIAKISTYSHTERP